ncbi:LysR family transcriptional regulator [Burkholderia multivorans]|uniref:LysR family transcriptional regulator n=1 Tax=Burkholderia multivorans TaxID=87883 RepID=A0A8E2URA1_9BURK|nr:MULTISPECIES: LysR family transcriptional regulator [Burkholderia]AJY16857.1 bacterial regulatory helix-turn-helix, lysR family protein [Burkholderia multivorans ATCC BAA-247]AVR18121.1 LysR family transcriptional regulator [Burkholderia multivorans]EJO58964.1 LysR substrate binding domain protein [Burkholderia multivorans ATCC BAA-247]KOE24602.1 LysR family transcriptional regulator [Burkholderia multivorans R-20526]MBU9247496.1 LysR family transcriptional regulator [Burkholderia multivora
MRLSKIDLNLFVVFDAIYNKRNLTRAAELLNLTQPAVSNALARMRKTLNDPLFVSTPAGMMPTPFAENIVGRVREALQLLDSSVHEGDVFDPASSERVFRLSMSDLTEALLLPALGELLQRQAPGMHVRSYTMDRREIATALANGTVDIAIDAPLLGDPHLHQASLVRDRYACMIRDGHPFKGDTLTMDDYLAMGHIHVSSRRKGSGHVDAELTRLGLRRNIQMRVQHYMVAPLIAMRGDLALTAPLRLLQRYPARILELPFEMPGLEYFCYWHRSADQDQANRWLRERLAELMRDIV